MLMEEDEVTTYPPRPLLAYYNYYNLLTYVRQELLSGGIFRAKKVDQP
jgi:hypothetical protein